MDSKLSVFEHENFGKVRTLLINNEPWAVAKDVAAALGYKRTADAVREHCEGVGEIQTPSKGGVQVTKIIPESDIYRLIMRSQLPSAIEFQSCEPPRFLQGLKSPGFLGGLR